MGSSCKDGRRNALVKNQRWIELGYIDNISMERFIAHITKDKKLSIYGFSGQSLLCNVRIDWRKNTNANWIGDFFLLLDEIKDGTVDVFVLDPPFEFYNPSVAVWKALVKRGVAPKSILTSKYLGHPNEWQREVFKKLKPGGIMVTKRNMPNTNVLSKIPQMFYVHDARPMAHIVRIDYK